MKKEDDLSPAHLAWLVESRARNQAACLALFKIIENSPTKAKSKTHRFYTYYLVSVGFSLWRAAFLADHSRSNSETSSDARAFLAQIITNNSINYAQDRASREWTFSYYMIAASYALTKLSRKWPEIAVTLSKESTVRKGTTKAHRRWDRHQTAFEVALSLYEETIVD